MSNSLDEKDDLAIEDDLWLATKGLELAGRRARVSRVGRDCQVNDQRDLLLVKTHCAHVSL